MRDLKPRVLTALVLIPLVMAAIYYLPPLWFRVVSGGIFLVAGWEWARLSGVRAVAWRLVFSIFIGSALIGVTFLASWMMSVLGIVAALFIISGMIFYCRRPCSYPQAYGLLLGIILLPLCWQALNALCLQPPRPYYLLTLFLLIWSADTVAYFTGSRWGKHKLAPMISPGKSWEGVMGALVFVSILALCLAKWWGWTSSQYEGFVLLAILVVIASIIGDLLESLLKRQQGLKDSGKLLPGHGGILDRIDSLITAAPLFLAGLKWLHIL